VGIQEEVSNNRETLDLIPYTTTLREVLGQYKDEELVIDPEFQRLFRWSGEQQTQFIESLLLGFRHSHYFSLKTKMQRPR